MRIPRVLRAPRLDDFLAGSEREAETRISGFLQFEPGDGLPASQETVAYLSYDSQKLYVVFVCLDEPGKIRGRLSRREDIQSDDHVLVNRDTFRDHRHAYNFICNPLGIQRDEIFTEGQGPDPNFDTVWHSEGRMTRDGYVVLMAIPFKSLRFPAAANHSWGIALAGRYSATTNSPPGQGLLFRPSPRLRFDHTYLYTRLASSQAGNAVIFNDHLLRSKLHYQFTRQLSARLIVDYHSVLANTQLVALEQTRRLSADLLLTFLLNPFTAIYAGYTDTYENLDLLSRPRPVLHRTASPGFLTGRQFFVKLSYLLRK